MQAYRIKRIYEPPSPDDGFRVLVDRIWPRGISRADARLDLWLKSIAPGTGLHQWFGHQPDRFPDFRRRDLLELADNPAVQQLRDAAEGQKQVVLLYGAKDSKHNQAAVLLELLNS